MKPAWLRTLLPLALPPLLWVLLASRSIGHLLLWDEAMQLCTLRSFLDGGDYFSNWFWRHPPLMSLLMWLCAPHQEGFDIRVEVLVLALGAVNIMLLQRLGRNIHGASAGFWSALIYAILPGQLTLGTWIKTDALAITFGLLALNVLARPSTAAAAILLGLALLSKETAIFYLLAAALLLTRMTAPCRSWRNAMRLLIFPVLLTAWWYIGFGSGLPGNESSSSALSSAPHLLFAFRPDAWSAPWNSYFVQLPLLLGWIGLALAIMGAFILLRPVQPGIGALSPQFAATRLWPLALLVPSYLLLTLLPAKVPWVVTVLLPGWAALAGIAVSQILRLAIVVLTSSVIRYVIPALIIGAVIVNDAARTPETITQQLAPGQWIGARRSREIATALDQRMAPGDKVLMTSFHYWRGIGPAAPCAVFTYYSQAATACEFHLRPFDASPDALIQDVLTHEIDWAVLSPPADGTEQELFRAFELTFGPPIRCEGAFIYSTHRATP